MISKGGTFRLMESQLIQKSFQIIQNVISEVSSVILLIGRHDSNQFRI